MSSDTTTVLHRGDNVFRVEYSHKTASWEAYANDDFIGRYPTRWQAMSTCHFVAAHYPTVIATLDKRL